MSRSLIPNPSPAARRMRLCIERARMGLKPLPVPWDYLTLAAFKEIAAEAYRVATWRMVPEVHRQRVALPELRRVFAEELAEVLRLRLLAEGRPEAAPERRQWRRLRATVPASWRPQYPLFAEKEPANVADVPGSVTNADEGNVDALHSTP